jgi:hypothetical protein
LVSMRSSNADLRESWRWHPGGGLPAWLVSLAVHFTALTALGLTVRTAPQGAANEAVRAGGIVLVARAAAGAEYFSDEDREPITAATFQSPENTRPSLPDAFPQPTATGPRLPSPEPTTSGETAAANNLPSATAISASGAAGGHPGRGNANAIETQVFGVRGKGTRFVYVFDRSSSMEGGPLIAAKRELIASLQSLQSVHQFQVIFYNQEPQLMTLRGHSPQMVFADEPGKRLAASFVGGLFAYGATDHMQALQTALRLRPDVIFFLTDAEEPQLRPDDFQRIRRLNQGTSINAIEFGIGPRQARYSFLQQLAAENGGQHAYIDITRLVR